MSEDEGNMNFDISECLPSAAVNGIPFNKDGTWSFVKTTASLTIYLDETPLTSMVYSDSSDESCREKEFAAGQANFRYTSTSNDEYREFPKSSCGNLSLPLLMDVEFDKSFPVPSGTAVKISYSCPSESVKYGSTEITCHADSIYIFTRTPQCIPIGECTGLYPAWNYVTTSASFPVPTGTVIQLIGYDGLKISGSTQITCVSGIFYTHAHEEPNFTPEAADGWKKPVGEKKYDIELTNSPLQILTNSPKGTNKHMIVYFWAETERIGELTIKFEWQPWYRISYCEGNPVRFQNLPDTSNKVWTIVLTDRSLNVYCNAVEVLNIVFSDKEDDFCKEKWQQKIKQIQLPNHHVDTSDYYRQQPVKSCTGLPDYWSGIVTTSTAFPAANGEVISLTETCPDGNKYFGPTEVTCLDGTMFSFARSPQCMPGGDCTGLYPGWNYLKTETKFPVSTGTLIDVRCYDGLQITGSTQITCHNTIFYTYANGEPLCNQEAEDGWIKPEAEIKYDIDLSGSPLQILTKTPKGTNRHLIVYFWTDTEQIGDLTIKFEFQPWYRISYCEGNPVRFQNLPDTPNKVWSIVVTEDSFTVYCNAVEVFYIVFSDKEDDFCKEKWQQKIKRIHFPNHHVDTSDYYRQQPVKKCTGLPDYWSGIVTTSTAFPAANGEVISLTETCPDGNKYFGPTEVTCLDGTMFSFARSPQCMPGGDCTGLYPGWNYLKTETKFPVSTGTVIDVRCYNGLQITGSTQITCHNTIFYTYANGEPLCNQEAEDGWIKPEAEIKYDIDLSGSPLQILTKTPKGTNRHLIVYFWTDTEQIGDLTIKFEFQPWYRISYCEGNPVRFQDLPDTPNKVWSIVVTEDSFTVYCNAVEVFNIVFSDKEDDFCKEKWQQKIKQIQFPNHHVDTSDYYRQQPVKRCTGLPDYWSGIVTTSTAFPAANGEVISLTETCPDGNKYFGPTEVTCLDGTMFSFARSPQCMPGGDCTGLYPGWNYLKTEAKFPVSTGTLIDVRCYDGLQITGSTQITCHNTIFYTYANGEPLCNQEAEDGWIKPEAEIKYDIDVSGSPLQILTKTPKGTNRHLIVYFWTDTEQIGELTIKFEFQPWYRVSYCEGNPVRFQNLPDTPNMVWTIVLTERSLTVYCNAVEFFNIVFSDKEDDFCKEKWQQKIKRIHFPNHHVDTSDYYRQQPVKSCTGLPDYWSGIVTTSTAFPAANGEVISLTETCPDGKKYFGPTEVTCLDGPMFSFARSPQCMPAGDCTGLYPGWNYLKTETKFPVSTGTVIDVSCYDGLQMSGSAQVTCISGFYFIQDEIPSCSASGALDWSKPVQNLKFPVDLQKVDLLVLTNTQTGTNRHIHLTLYRANQHLAELYVKFAVAPTYWVTSCHDNHVPFSNLPATQSKLWSFSTSSGSLVVKCNGIKVMEVLLSREECGESWSDGLDSLLFGSADSASDFYKLNLEIGRYF